MWIESSTLIKKTSLWKIWRSLHKTTPNQTTEIWSPDPLDTRMNTPISRSQGTLHKGDAETVEQESQGAWCEVLYACKVRLYTCTASPAWVHRCKLNKDDDNWLDKAGWRKKSPHAINLTQSTLDSWGVLGAREIVFNRREHTDCFSNKKQSALKTYTYRLTLYRLSRLHFEFYMYID